MTVLAACHCRNTLRACIRDARSPATLAGFHCRVPSYCLEDSEKPFPC